MTILFAILVGFSASIFGVTAFYEIKNRKSVRQKAFKKMMPRFGFKFKTYAYSILSMGTGLLSFFTFNSDNTPIEAIGLTILSFAVFILLLAFECLNGIKHMTIGNIFSKKEISKLVHLNEKSSSFIRNGLRPLSDHEHMVDFEKKLKDGNERMSIDEFCFYKVPSEKLEAYLEMKMQLQLLEEVIESNLLNQYVDHSNQLSIEGKKAAHLIESIKKGFSDMRLLVGKQTFSKKAVQQVEEEKQKQHQAISNESEKALIPNDLGLALLDMKSVSDDENFSSEDRRRADEYVLRIEKELEHRNKETRDTKLKEDVHVLFRTVETVLQKNNIH